jgi:hypothetical protein
MSNQNVAMTAILGALSWARPQGSESQTTAPRTFIYRIERAEFAELVKSGRQHMLPPDYERIGLSRRAATDCHAELRLYNYEEALSVDH